uniref:Uncharacterized protein n=1 Tax=Oryza punctata TaxID=4537 RepID=A0A0E0JXU9_ORYPU
MAEAATGATDTSLPPPPHVVLLASPGAGHLIPLAELARRLVSEHGFAVTVVTLAGLSGPSTDAAVLSSLPASVATAVLPPVALDDLPADIGFGSVMFELVRRSVPHLRALVVGSTTAAIVCDFFSTPALALAAELGVPGYVFFPTSISFISVVRSVVELHDGGGGAAGEYRDLPVPLALPGCAPLRHGDIPDGFRDCADPVYAYVLEEGRRYGGADGFLVNSFPELEPGAAEAFRRDAENGAFPPC